MGMGIDAGNYLPSKPDTIKLLFNISLAFICNPSECCTAIRLNSRIKKLKQQDFLLGMLVMMNTSDITKELE